MRILVPLDGTAQAELAVRPAAEVASFLKKPSQIVLLNVLTLPELMGIEVGSLVQKRRRYLDLVKEDLALPDGDVETMVRYGDPVEVICSVARQQDVDLIVLTSHDQPEYSARRSIADEVVERSSIPTITLRSDDTTSSGTGPESFIVLASHCDAPQGEAALRCAQFLAQRYSVKTVSSRTSVAAAGSR